MRDGDIFKFHVDIQRNKTKIGTAKDLGISKTTLYQYFETEKFTPDVKENIIRYFKKDIFSSGVGTDYEFIKSKRNRKAKEDYNTNNDKFKEERALIQVLLLEVSKLKSRVFGVKVEDAIDEQ